MIQQHVLPVGVLTLVAVFCASPAAKGERTAPPAEWAEHILTPPAGPAPRINGPTIYGASPGVPFLYAVPATGERPLRFTAENLPAGLAIDAATGHITGVAEHAGTSEVLLRAENAHGTDERVLRIALGDRLALTPPMGWNSWNCWAESVDQEKVLRSARALAASGLAQHGWVYVNIDDAWQGRRGGPHNAIQPNEKFPDMKALCDEIHALGLKPGIYSTPWVTSYAKRVGGSSDNPDGEWTEELATYTDRRLGKHSFAKNDARQWAEWGIDYLKYDWAPIDVPHVKDMSDALRGSGRDIVFSLSNSAPIEHADALARLSNCWRTTGDVWDYWDYSDVDWKYGVSEIGFAQQQWAKHAGPGHWNDPDMLVVGQVGWGPELHWTQLTPDEQYTHISLWCMLSAPLLIGCDLETIDPFTLSLLTNDEVLAVNQDALGVQATCVATSGAIDVYLKPLEDGGRAMAFFNRGDSEREYVFNKLVRVGVPAKQRLRDLWRQKDLGEVDGEMTVTVPAHGVVLLKLTEAEDAGD